MILGRNINDHIHQIFPHDPLAVRPISGSSKKHVSVGSSESVHQNKWYYQPLKTKINSILTNHRHGVGVCLRCVHDSFYWMPETQKGGTSWLCLFGIWPKSFQMTLNSLLFGLHRVSGNVEQNMMSAGNLGIVFGPTLLRPLVTFDMSMVALVESTYQSLLVEVLITHYPRVFGPKTRASPPPPPTAPLPGTPPRPPCPLADPETPGTVPEQGGSCRDRPQSLQVRALTWSYMLLWDENIP